MDEQLVTKMYPSIAIAWIIAMVWTLLFQKPWIALSISIGVAVATASLAAFNYIASRAFKSGAAKPKHALIKFGLVKYFLIGVLLYFLVRWDRINLPAFCGGIALMNFAIVAKVLGLSMVEELNSTVSSDGIQNKGS
jgi:hypothetical protein